MNEPAQIRDPNLLNPMFKAALDAWRLYASAYAAGYSIHYGETLRTQERQDWLWKEGRDNDHPKKTWTQTSVHQYGLACDIYLTDAQGNAVWDSLKYKQLYAVAPPSLFGLVHLGGIGDWVHLQYATAEDLAKTRAVSKAA